MNNKTDDIVIDMRIHFMEPVNLKISTEFGEIDCQLIKIHLNR